MKKTIIILIVLVVVIVGIYFIISNNQQNVNQVNVPVAQSQDTTAGATVSIKNLAFNPQTLKIKAGTKVTWINNDPMAHTVASDSDGLLSSSTLSSGQSFSFTFTNPGSTSYHCNIHKTMKGVIIVE